MSLKKVKYMLVALFGFNATMSVAANSTLNCYTESYDEHMLVLNTSNNIVDNYTNSKIVSVQALEAPAGYYWTLPDNTILPLPLSFKRHYSCLIKLEEPESTFPIRRVDLVTPDQVEQCERLESEVWVFETVGENGQPSAMNIWFDDDMRGASVRFDDGRVNLYCNAE